MDGGKLINRHVILYGLYCLGVLIFAGKAISDGYSPFAVAGARPPILAIGASSPSGGSYYSGYSGGCSDDDCSDDGYSGSGGFGGYGRHHSFGPTHK